MLLFADVFFCAFFDVKQVMKNYEKHEKDLFFWGYVRIFVLLVMF